MAVDPPPADRASLVHRMADVMLRAWAGEECPVGYDVELRPDGHLHVVTVTVGDRSFVSVDPPALCTAGTTDDDSSGRGSGVPRVRR